MQESNDNKKSDFVDKAVKAAHRFEAAIVMLLVCVIGLITLLAIIRLFAGLFDAVFINWDIKNTHMIQVLFGMVMTVLIALELGNSILKHLRDNSTIIQAKEIILIGIMAVIRKIMLVDLSQASPTLLASLGAVAMALAASYWFMRETE